MTLAACAALVARGDPDRFATAMSGPVPARALLFPLYAFNLEIARAPMVPQEPLIAEMRLQWWRDALDEIAAGGAVRGHEVTGPLADVIRSRGLDVAVADALVAARRWDIGREGFAGDAALWEYLDATSGGLMWLSAQALGAGPRHEAAIRRAGQAMGLASFLRAAPGLVARGRVPLPDPSPGTVALLAAEGVQRWQEARHDLRGQGLPRGVATALRAGWQTLPLLRQARTDPGRVAEGRLALSEVRRRGRLLRLGLTGGW